jgi:site-specific recombinase XerD
VRTSSFYGVLLHLGVLSLGCTFIFPILRTSALMTTSPTLALPLLCQMEDELRLSDYTSTYLGALHSSNLRILSCISASRGHSVEQLDLRSVTRVEALSALSQTRASRPHLSPATLHKEFQCFSRFIRWAFASGYLDRNILDFVKPPRIPRKPRAYLTTSEICSVYDVASVSIRHRLMILLLATSGVRLAELVGILVSDVDSDLSGFLVRGKGGHSRWVPVPAFVRPVLSDYLVDRSNFLNTHSVSNNPYLFVRTRNFASASEPLSHSSVYPVLNALLSSAGVKVVGSCAHTFRRSFATIGLDSSFGGIYTDTQMIEHLGHASSISLTRYRRVSRAELSALVESHPVSLALASHLSKST